MSVIEGTLTVVATIFFLPCICLVGGGIVARDLIIKARAYERPKTRRSRESKERQKEIIRSTPRKVGPRLERHLTIGRPEAEANDVAKDEAKDEAVDLAEVKGIQMVDLKDVGMKRLMTVTDQQENSVFFQLPLEIRRGIYKNVLGGYVIHVYFVEAYRRMGHTRCKSRAPEVCKGVPCKQIVKVKGAKDAWGNIGLLPLLQSCRRV